VEVEKFRPVVQLTDFGDEVMKAQKPLQRPLPIPEYLFHKIHGEKSTVPQSQPPIEGAAPAVLYENDADLLTALKRWRLEIAHQSGVPAFGILYNSTLNELISHRPQTATELLEIKGIGPAKLKQFGQSMLEIIAEYTD